MNNVLKKITGVFMLFLSISLLPASSEEIFEKRSLYQMQVGHAPSQKDVKECVKHYKKQLEECQDFEITIQGVRWKIDQAGWYGASQDIFYDNFETYTLAYKGNGPYLPVAVAFMEGQVKRLSFRLSKTYSK
jgi:hypothetical protein